jgi:hypothetical protein
MPHVLLLSNTLASIATIVNHPTMLTCDIVNRKRIKRGLLSRLFRNEPAAIANPGQVTWQLQVPCSVASLPRYSLEFHGLEAYAPVVS